MPKLTLSDMANVTSNTEEGLTLSVEQQRIAAAEDNSPHKTISMSQPGVSNKPKVDINSLRNSRGQNKSNGTRTADLSVLPNDEKIPDGMNVKIKDSIEAEIFEQGGAFDKYLDEKKKEYSQYVGNRLAMAEKIKAEKEIAAEDKDIDDNENYDINNKATNEEIDKETTIVNAKSFKKVDIRRQPSNTKKEETMEDNIVHGNVQEFANPDMVTEEEYPIKIDIANQLTPQQQEEVEEVVDNTPEDDEDYLTSVDNLSEGEVASEITSPKLNEPEFLEDGEELEEEYEEKQNVPIINKKSSNKDKLAKKIDRITKAYMAIPSEDGDEDDLEVTDSDSNDESMTILKNMIAEKIKPVSVKMDISGFTVAKKGTMSNEIFTVEQASFAKWPLPATGITIEMREISGANLENLRGFLDRRTPDNRSALKIIYDHIVSPKPNSFEAWLNSVAYADFDNLFMLVYISAFADANFLPVDCTNPDCEKPYITNNLPIMDLVKFKNKESEEKFWELYNEEPTNSKGLYTTHIIPISDKFAIGLKEPSLYSVLIEPNYFNAEFMDKYAQTIRYFPYIDSLYWIDAARKNLVPIKWQVYDNNASKTARSRVRKYSMIMNTLTSDQHALILSYINAINERVDWMSYRRPETTCPHCGQVVPEDDTYTALSLVFLRNRLAVLATT